MDELRFEFQKLEVYELCMQLNTLVMLVVAQLPPRLRGSARPSATLRAIDSSQHGGRLRQASETTQEALVLLHRIISMLTKLIIRWEREGSKTR